MRRKLDAGTAWRLVTIGLLGLLLYGCARQVSPTGGPVDKVPPEVLSVVPANRSTGVSKVQTVEFEFSEAMDRRTLEKALFIAPDPGEDGVELKWKGRTLRIQLRDSLKTDRTYVITLGTDLRDSHGNPLAQSQTLAFSTGAEISDSRISGQVFSQENVQGTLIWAYILEGSTSPDPARSPASYITQTDAGGKFELPNLSAGNYRVFAIRDKDNNRFFEVGIDGIGVPQSDVWLPSDSTDVGGVNFRIAIQDTLGAGLVSVAATNKSSVTLRFDEPLAQQATAVPANYEIVTTAKSQPESLAVRFSYLRPDDAQEIYLTTAPQTAGAEYQVTVHNLTDLSANPLDPGYNSDIFSASALPDTFRPQIRSVLPKDSSRAVALNSPVSIVFDEPARKQTFVRGFSVSDSASNSIVGAHTWRGPASAVFTPEQPWLSKMRYQVSVKLDSVVDLAGNASADSVLSLNFTAVNADTFSSISGTIADEDSMASGKIYLKARQGEPDGPAYDLVLDAPGSYKFKNILPGVYQIEGFRDRDGDGAYSHGHALPFVPAERFFVYKEEIKARARWPNEGNDLSFDGKQEED